MKSRLLCVLFVCLLGVPVVHAGELTCPDLSKATQVATCPSEEELKYTFNGYCADNARLYEQDKETCASFENYRKLKNVALWESADGEFQAYVSCDLTGDTIRAAKARRVSVGKAGKLTRVSCDYGDDIVFAYRTRASCRTSNAGQCIEGQACGVRCD
jgi:hypothetical protein